MGVVNVTPDSFSDGGQFDDAAQAVDHGRRLVAEGADIIDVGGESTRPGADPVPVEEELARVIPVVEGLVGSTRVSIDTMKLAVAEAAVEAGATLRQRRQRVPQRPRHGGLRRRPRARLLPDAHARRAADDAERSALRRRGERRQGVPRGADAVRRSTPACAEERIQLDPGIGFGKTLEHNLELLARLDELIDLGRPLVIGTSRKSFIGKLTGRDVTGRVHGTTATCVIALERGARVFRVHDVAAVADALKVAAATFATMADEPEDYEDDDLDDDDDEEGLEVGVTVEIVGLSLYTHHGVTAEERKIGQRLLLDVRFDAGEPDALITDRVEDTIDYGEVCQVIALIAQAQSYRTLERLCAVIADRLASQFGADSVTVKATKPEPPIPLPVEEVSVEVWREER